MDPPTNVNNHNIIKVLDTDPETGQLLLQRDIITLLQCCLLNVSNIEYDIQTMDKGYGMRMDIISRTNQLARMKSGK